MSSRLVRYHCQRRNVSLKNAAAGSGVSHLEQQHQGTGSYEAPPQLYALKLCHSPHAQYQHDGLCRCRYHAGFVVAQYLVCAQQYLCHSKRYQHQGKDTQYAVQFECHHGIRLHTEEVAHQPWHIHHEDDDSHQHGNDNQSLLHKDLQSLQVTLCHQHAANGKHRLYHTVNKHIRQQQHLQTYRPYKQAVATQIPQYYIIDKHDGHRHQRVTQRNRRTLFDVIHEDAAKTLAGPLQAIRAA